MYNALACLIVALAFDIEFNIAKDAIESFAGVKRRCQKIVETDGVVVYHDYAHHPLYGCRSPCRNICIPNIQELQ